MTRPALILYASLYLGWFACVLLGKWGLDYLAPIVPMIGWGLFLKTQSPTRQECETLLALCLFGMAVDAGLMKLNVVHYAGEPLFLPVWMAALWLLFAPALYFFARLFKGRVWLAALAGGLFGPLCYKSGESFGVLTLPDIGDVIVYAIFWALFLPLAIVVARPRKKL